VSRTAALLLMAALLAFSGCGETGTPPPAAPTAVRAALEARLLDRNLSYHWVVCVRTEGAFAGLPIFRCNVNFGEPHIVRYCATFEDGRLVTNREQPRIRCGRRALSYQGS
jgi:hypothetical protein